MAQKTSCFSSYMIVVNVKLAPTCWRSLAYGADFILHIQKSCVLF